MKITRYLIMAGWGISIILAGCQRPEPETPKLIAPVDGAAFDTIPPTLTWSASNPEGEYTVKLNISAGGKDQNVSVAVKDTTYTPSIEGIEYATFKWCVGVEVDTGTLWSETWTFYIDARENVPDLILPDIGAVFDSLPPTFVWSKEDVSEYYLMVFKDSLWSVDTLLWDTLQDTTYTLSMNTFTSADSGIYEWTVAVRDTSTGDLLYPSPRSFRIKLGDTPLPPIDLDTTYFPFGLGYEWCYETHSYGNDDYGANYNRYDTFTIQIIDSIWTGDTLVFSLSGGKFRCVDNKIWDNSIEIGSIIMFDYVYDTIYVVNPEPFDLGELSLSYSGDTLNISGGSSFGYQSLLEYIGEGTRRIKGIGSISQARSYQSSSSYSSNSDRLLYFYNGKDTIYKAEDWREVIDVALDTTYFPMGEGNEWTYQRRSWGSTQSGDSTITWDDYDTFTVSVADSFWESNVMLVSFSDTGKFFHDLSNPAKVMDGKVLIDPWKEDAMHPWINPYLPETKWGSEICYSKDTLEISFGGTPTGEDPNYSYYQEWTYRLRNIGPILQGTSYSNWDFGEESYTRDSLISFIRPQNKSRRWNWK